MSRLIIVVGLLGLLTAGVAAGSEKISGPETLILKNSSVELQVRIDSTSILEEHCSLIGMGSTQRTAYQSNAGFSIECMWTDWSAPDRFDNADNLILLTQKDFQPLRYEYSRVSGGSQLLRIDFKGNNQELTVSLYYKLDDGVSYFHRRITVNDTTKTPFHFLRRLNVVDIKPLGTIDITKRGGFGQPIVWTGDEGTGGFLGVEFPASTNEVFDQSDRSTRIRCGQEIGQRIDSNGVASDWCVVGVTHDTNVKLWFWKYLNAIRVAPPRPYTLYNSWYDLRSPEYPRVPKENVMNEESSLKMIQILRNKMIDHYGIKLDAFVLDDGWDVYESDWVIRPHEFPHGLSPLSTKLRETGTQLGIWLGPIGGYSFRKKRIAWMSAHGYETIGDELCVAGTKYGALFEKRVMDFVKNDGVGYFKWDGIQFSCSQPDHGHPIDVYSRRAIMNRVASWSDSVRSLNPSAFLNITSGTWLSPWWLRFANTIWMQGEDYGYADVPSISARDAAITYRDFVLWDGLKNHDRWFPIDGLMTHGIIKGKLELLGSPEEPLSKFTDDVLLYVARGISMYEMYISPDIMSDGEWHSIASSLAWAKDRFSTLMTTEMVGGNPLRREPYGYVHFSGARGIIAARNPFITSSSITVRLSENAGIARDAKNLAAEIVYPYCEAFPMLYQSGDSLTIPLKGYETVVVEIYPVSEAKHLLLSGTRYGFDLISPDSMRLRYIPAPGIAVLNPELVDARLEFERGGLSSESELFHCMPLNVASSQSAVSASIDIRPSVHEPSLAILLIPDSTQKVLGTFTAAKADGTPLKPINENKEGKSRWYTIPLQSGMNEIRITVHTPKDSASWNGRAEFWVNGYGSSRVAEIPVRLHGAASPEIHPPQPIGLGLESFNKKIGETPLVLKTTKH